MSSPFDIELIYPYSPGLGKYQAPLNPPCGLNASFNWTTALQTLTAFDVNGQGFSLSVENTARRYYNESNTFYLLYRATQDPTMSQGWVDLIPMFEVASLNW